jgi:hypothetical protein
MHSPDKTEWSQVACTMGGNEINGKNFRREYSWPRRIGYLFPPSSYRISIIIHRVIIQPPHNIIIFIIPVPRALNLFLRQENRLQLAGFPMISSPKSPCTMM